MADRTNHQSAVMSLVLNPHAKDAIRNRGQLQTTVTVFSDGSRIASKLYVYRKV